MANFSFNSFLIFQTLYVVLVVAQLSQETGKLVIFSVFILQHRMKQLKLTQYFKENIFTGHVAQLVEQCMA